MYPAGGIDMQVTGTYVILHGGYMYGILSSYPAGGVVNARYATSEVPYLPGRWWSYAGIGNFSIPTSQKVEICKVQSVPVGTYLDTVLVSSTLWKLFSQNRILSGYFSQKGIPTVTNICQLIFSPLSIKNFSPGNVFSFSYPTYVSKNSGQSHERGRKGCQLFQK